MEPQIRLVHWYDTEHHRIACGAAQQSNSTKHIRGVTCTACLAVASEARAGTQAGQDGVSYVH
jgi:hypothetical protein